MRPTPGPPLVGGPFLSKPRSVLWGRSRTSPGEVFLGAHSVGNRRQPTHAGAEKFPRLLAAGTHLELDAQPDSFVSGHSGPKRPHIETRAAHSKRWSRRSTVRKDANVVLAKRPAALIEGIGEPSMASFRSARTRLASVVLQYEDQVKGP